MDWRVPREALTDGASSVTVVAVDIKRNTSSPPSSRWEGPPTQPESADTGQPGPAGSSTAPRGVGAFAYKRR